MHTPPAPPPPRGIGPGASTGPGHNLVHLAPLRPPHVPALAGGGTLLPGVQRDGLLAPRRPVAGGRHALCAGIWVSPDTVLPQGHAPDFSPSCPSTTMLSSHSPCTTASLSRPPASPGPVSWCWQPRITPDSYVSGSGACLTPSVRPWPANYPNTLPPPTLAPVPPSPAARHPAQTS